MPTFKNYNGDPITIPSHIHSTADTVRKGSIGTVSSTEDGFMSVADKQELDTLYEQALDLVDKSNNIVYTNSASTNIVLTNGKIFNTSVKSLLPTVKTITFTKTAIPQAQMTNSLLASIGTTKNKLYMYASGDTIYVSPEKENDTIVANGSCNGMFEGLTSLTTVNFTNFDTSNVTDMRRMFYNDKSLTTINGTANWNTSNVTTLAYAFYYCEKLTSLDVTNWNVSNVTTLENTFGHCDALATLDVSKWNVSKVATLESTFYLCSSLQTLDVSNWNVSNVTTLHGVFNNCQKITSLNLTNWNTSKVTDMGNAFSYCASLTSITGLANLNTSNVTSFYYTFAASKLSTIDVSKYVTSKVTDWSNMFYKSSVTSITGLANLDTAAATNMAYMFSECTKLTSIDVSKFNTSNVQSMANMFSLSALTSLDITNFKLELLQNASYMFANCTALTTLKFPTATKTLIAKNLSFMFAGCGKLTNVNLSAITFIGTTNVKYMFNSCSNLNTAIKVDSATITDYTDIFNSCATGTSANVVVNYTVNAKTIATNMVNTKSTTSKVSLGVQVL